MKGFIVILALTVACRAGYPGPSNYNEAHLVGRGPSLHSYAQNIGPRYEAPPAPVGHDGNVVDTPEVAQAKAEHFAEYARAAQRAHEESKHQALERQEYNGQPGSPYYGLAPTSSSPYLRQVSNYQPSAPIYRSSHPSAYQGTNPETNYAASKAYQAGAQPGKHSQFVPAPLADDGTVVDTPEVAALKATRLAELADAQARAYKYSTDEYSIEGAAQGYSGAQGIAHGSYNPSGYAPVAQRAYPGPSSFAGVQGYVGGSQSYKPYPLSSAVFQPHSY